MIKDNDRIVICRLESKSTWDIITNPKYNLQYMNMNSVINNSGNNYIEVTNCGVVSRMIRVDNRYQYGIDYLKPEWVLSTRKLNDKLHTLSTPKKRKIDLHTILNSLILVTLLYILFFGCSGITAPVGVHIPSTSDKTIESTFDDPEYRSYGWMIPMPEYAGASIDIRDGLVWRSLPDEYYRLMVGIKDTDEYWIKIEDKEHKLSEVNYRVAYE
jgi:hypothetical protein